ncbi:MAG TPA: hypothetical protein VJB37_01605 [Patescibacteria group bacterium]|nr:hypothetical protein [Patescibacteria group bacterium]
MKYILSDSAQAVVKAFLCLPFPRHQVACPYYNNRRQRLRAALRVYVGKGSPEDIAQEATIIALREHLDLEKFSNEELRKFLIDNNLGIDCSGFCFHILSAQTHSQNRSLSSLYYPQARSLWRKLLIRLRPAENFNVSVLADERNSQSIPWTKARPGDFILMLKTGRKNDIDHVLIITEVETDEHDRLLSIQYTHSFAWSTDGRYDTGVRTGLITVTNSTQTLIQQQWEEKGQKQEKNETFLHAIQAQTLDLRRLRS